MNTDIELAHNCNLRAGLMVLSGFNSLADAHKCMNSTDPKDLKQVPHFYVEKLGDLLPLIESL